MWNISISRFKSAARYISNQCYNLNWLALVFTRSIIHWCLRRKKFFNQYLTRDSHDSATPGSRYIVHLYILIAWKLFSQDLKDMNHQYTIPIYIVCGIWAFSLRHFCVVQKLLDYKWIHHTLKTHQQPQLSSTGNPRFWNQYLPYPNIVHSMLACLLLNTYWKSVSIPLWRMHSEKTLTAV